MNESTPARRHATQTLTSSLMLPIQEKFPASNFAASASPISGSNGAPRLAIARVDDHTTSSCGVLIAEADDSDALPHHLHSWRDLSMRGEGLSEVATRKL